MINRKEMVLFWDETRMYWQEELTTLEEMNDEFFEANYNEKIDRAQKYIKFCVKNYNKLFKSS
jgi:hypothetical protein